MFDITISLKKKKLALCTVEYLIFNYVRDTLALQFVIIEDHFTRPAISYPFRYKTQTELTRLHTIDNHAMVQAVYSRMRSCDLFATSIFRYLNK